MALFAENLVDLHFTAFGRLYLPASSLALLVTLCLSVILFGQRSQSCHEALEWHRSRLREVPHSGPSHRRQPLKSQKSPFLWS